MVRLLVSVASGHGATREIAEAIATALAEQAIESEVQPDRRRRSRTGRWLQLCGMSRDVVWPGRA